MRARVETHLIEVQGQRCHRVRVVGNVKHQRRLARHDLKAPGQLHRGQALAHCLRRYWQVFAQGLEGGQHASGVEQLIGAAQCRVGHAAVAPATARPGPLLAVTRVIEVAPDQPQVGADGLRMRQHRLWRQRVTDDGRLAGAHDLGLLQANRLTVWPEVLHVIEIDAGDDGAVGIEGVDGVIAPAQPDLENHQVQRFQGQQTRDGQRGELELGQGDLAARSLNRREMRQQGLGRDGLAADTAALFEVHQLRLLVGADAPARRQSDRLQHRAGRAFAVGACHRDHGHRERQAQALLDLDRSLQRQVHRDRVHALAVREPVGERDRRHATASALWRCNMARVRAMVPRN